MGKLVFALIMVLALGSGCTPTSYSVSKATAQNWYGGAAGSGGGRIYRIFVSKTPKATLEVTKVWLGDKEGGTAPRFRTFRDSSNVELKGGKITSGSDLFRVEFSETFPAPPNPRQDEQEEDNPREQLPKVAPPITLPADFEKGAIISYSSNGKPGYWVVKDFKNLPPLAYP